MNSLFYPSHDLALACGVGHFNPPAAALQLEADLRGIEQWWQDDEPDAAPVPWGWSWDMRRRLLAAGVDRRLLPSDDDLERLRDLSSRRATLRVLDALGPLASGIERPRVVEDEATLRAVVADHRATGVPMVMKAPWSSSGRGQMRWPEQDDATFVRRGVSLIGRQGCAVVERWYDKVMDLAMLFRVRRDAVQWVGWSLFDCDDGGTYRSSVVACDAVLEDAIAAALPSSGRDVLHAVRSKYVADILPQLFAPMAGRAWEVGYVGVDMMVVADRDGTQAATAATLTRLHPCVEMNVRCTMGVVACQMARRIDSHLLPARFSIRRTVDGHFATTVEPIGASSGKSIVP